MIGYVLAHDADIDLQKIFWFTHERWGESQAELYLNSLFSIFETLAARPEMGRLRGELSATIRSFVHKRHVIYYIQVGDGIGISRVLHGAMDVEHADLFEG